MKNLQAFKIKFTDLSKPVTHPKRHREATIRAKDGTHAILIAKRIYGRITIISVERISEK